MWSDNEAKIDLINVNDKVSAIEDIINNDRLLPTTIGVFGDWGSGKSTLMRIVQESFEEDDQSSTITINFNGWVFEDYEDAKSALMGRIIDEIIKQKTLTDQSKQIVGKLFKRIKWFRLVGLAGKNILSMSITGGPSPGVLNDLSESFDTENIEEVLEDPERESLRKSIGQFREDFAQFLSEFEIEKLVVFIDDLDRCLPNTILDLFEAIRLFLFVPNTAFVIGADERIVEHAIKTRYPSNDSKFDVGRNYLEKIVQFPIRIPPMSVQETETYINLLFAKLHLDAEKFEGLCEDVLEYEPDTIFDIGFNINNYDDFLDSYPKTLEEDLSMSHQISRILTNGLQGNPRQIKRFLNTLILRTKMAKTKNIELSRKVLVKLMVLEYFEPSFYKTLGSLQAKEDGTPNLITELEEVKDGDKEIENSENEEVEAWLDNYTVNDWLELEPSLSSVDLRPYFYFSREDEDNYLRTKSRLGPNSKQVLGLLVSDSDSETQLGIQRLGEFNKNEISQVFNEIIDKIHRAETNKERAIYTKVGFKICESIPFLIPDLLKVLEDISPSKLGVATPQMLFNIKEKASSPERIETLVRRWTEDDTNKRLQQAAKQVLN